MPDVLIVVTVLFKHRLVRCNYATDDPRNRGLKYLGVLFQ